MRSHHLARAFLLRCRQPSPSLHNHHLRKLVQCRLRPFHSTSFLSAIKTQRLTDIGEGNKEVQIIQWYITEGARVEEWDNLCQVQSDKAADDITARYGGVVKKLYCEPDDTVQTGEPLVDIDVAEEDAGGEDQDQLVSEEVVKGDSVKASSEGTKYSITKEDSEEQVIEARGKHSALATPAVRGLLKEHGIDITSIRGTGRDGRVLKEDIYQYLKSREPSQNTSSPPSFPYQQPFTTPPHAEETTVPLSPIQAAMYRSMTASLSIPHFLFTSEVDITALTALRRRLNSSTSHPSFTASENKPPKLTLLPFITKALSVALTHYPLLNARLSTPSPQQSHPSLTLRPHHNIGIAMDTPSGLLVPVIHNVNPNPTPTSNSSNSSTGSHSHGPSPSNGHSITTLASSIARLSSLATLGRLTTADLSHGTVTLSNVGALGGGNVVLPRLVEGQTLIVGVGRSRAVPSYVFDGEDGGKGKEEILKKRELVTLSWAADHRVVDGGTVARAAGMVKALLEDVGRLGVELR